MTEVMVNVLQHDQTGKIHIVQLELSDLRHCYCSLNRRREPEERTIDLTEENVCETCVKGYLDENGEEEVEEGAVEAGDAARLREALGE